MKSIFLICFCFVMCYNASAQDSTTTYPYKFIPSATLKAWLTLYDGHTIKGYVVHITDSFVALSKYPIKTTDTFLYSNICITDIQSIKLKRNSLLRGMVIGGVSAIVLPYAIATCILNGPVTIEELDSETKQKFAIVYSVLGLSGALVGGVVYDLKTQKKFEINGNFNNIQNMIDNYYAAK
ncbi:hypothetical protein [Limnovirga soli]|uniref:Uncharacterized protein n=1 Tax=Limnovirga soli TaxID=2656915 RepID=A0A8J8JWJ5_9BACT|nr:hypothetical protein [Limnovirga soli]NNV55371.1 hypothetical protein [Limnovirga soli]